MKLVQIVVLSLAVLLTTPVLAGSADDIRAVIEDQIAAFETDDGDRAFSHASPGIQARFRNPENFMEMVRTGYPQVYRPRAVEFQQLEQSGSLTIQEVFFFGQNGSAVVARYFMQQNAEGVWKITGVDLRQAPELGV
ncbi:DUF4864 domain-containing protein [Minwuia sp.]|uniref:DUF4864 domain-containing protein n=1 Tax=Minwuia sp. TaxID=2493630 RepID=UPI003A945DD6